MDTIVDTHCHAGLEKYEPIEALIDQMFRNRVTGAVLVQHLGQYDNRYLIECAQRFPGKLAIVALVDVADENAPAQLAAWAAHPFVRGVRLSASERSPGRNPWAIWEKAEELGLSVSFHGLAADYAVDASYQLASRFRQCRFVIEHLGRPDLAAGTQGRAFQQVLKFADLPHVSIKLSGFHVYSPVKQTRYPEFMPFVRAALDAFGPERCMWGSNYPPVSSAEGFHNTLSQARDDWPWRDERERRLVLGETAAVHYRLPAH